MNSKEIEVKVIECVAESLALEIDEINENSLLISELDADSLDIMDIMFLLEDKFSIKLEKEDFNFLNKIDMDRKKAVDGEFLTVDAKEKLREWLPAMDVDNDIRPSDLGSYLSIFSMIKLIEGYVS